MSRRAGWTVRPKGARDASAATKLLAEVAREGSWLGTEWPFDVTAKSEWMRSGILDRRQIGWCVEDGAHMIADLSVYEVDEPEPEIGIIVAGPYRGRGIGRALIVTAIEWAESNGRTALRLRVFPDNDSAIGLYRAVGFVDIERRSGTVPRKDGSLRDVLFMRRPIAERR
ncbi:MAG TPA: GNAT family N-acetyltransferase [Candidatus Elarobacter sp.]